MTSTATQVPNTPRTGFSGLQVVLILLGVIILMAVLAWWLFTRYVMPTELRQVNLSQQEQVELDRKLEFLGITQLPAAGAANNPDVKPEPYSELGASREIQISERELNGLLARDPALASRVAIDLSPDLISLNALVPVPDDFPLMPGKRVRVRAGAELIFRNGRPVLILKGVSVMGVPIPNSWLGNMKGIDLFAEVGVEDQFLTGFANGIDDISVRDGHLRVRLRE